MSLYKKQRDGKNGFTIVELVTAMLVGAAIMGVVVLLLSTGIRMMTSNVAYSAAQRGALSTVEMLSKEIPAALKVEIIADGAHDLSAGLADGWHYVSLDRGSKEGRHIYQEYDDNVDEKISGSEYIEALSFDTELKDKPGGGGRLLRVSVEAAYGADEVKTVDLNRTMLVHAASGVTGDSSAGAVLPPPPAGGALLRYLPENPLTLSLDVYGSTNTGKHSGKAPFDEDPVTWEYLKNFNYFTELDARLKLPPRLLNAFNKSGKSGEDVTFTFIVADPTIFGHDIVDGNANKNPEAILEYLEGRVPDYLEEEVGWDLMDRKYPDADEEEEMIAELIDDPFNLQAGDMTKGFQLMAVMNGKPVDGSPGSFELKPKTVGAGEQKFNFGAAVNGVAMAYDYYKGAYMIVVAKVPYGNDSWKKWPVYVKLGDYKDDTLFTDMLIQLAEKGKPNPNTHIGDTFLNAQDKFGELKEIVTEGERRYFEVTGKVAPGATPAAIVMKELTPKDFSHMIPRGATKSDDVLYGVTNYAIYVDAEVPDSGTGGFAVLMNGSKVHMQKAGATTKPKPLDESDTNNKYDKNAEYTSAGYYYQFDPGANGLLIRYFGYHPTNLSYPYKYGQVNGYQWGARPMYFYDAAKEMFSAPKEVSFFTTAATAGFETENFNENAGAGADDQINYRIPFSANQRNSMFTLGGEQVGGAKFSSVTEGRDEEPYGGMRAASTYGVTQGPGGGATSVYSPKHMQSWHNYGKKVVDMLPPDAKGDERIGFRWDRSWLLPKARNENTEIQQHIVWEQRHILKLTILEVTRDITAGEVNDEWRYNLHHKNEATLNKLEPLPEDYVIHKSGDMFVRAELIQLKPGATDWNNSRNYVYSKPIWHGKFKGDAWRGDYPSPFKKLGNAMQHIVADPEPEEGDDQAYRRRGMRVRSWKESFLGWDFSKVTSNYRYVWRDFVNGNLPPDFYESVYDADVVGRIDSGFLEDKRAHSVWTPPIAIDFNAEKNNGVFTDDTTKAVSQDGDIASDSAIAYSGTFGQYKKTDQYVERERRGADIRYNGKYSPDIYGRLSLIRPWRDAPLPNQATPIFGLYALRGWDFGTSRSLDVGGKMKVYDSPGNTVKRFLSVVQGLQIPYLPTDVRPATNGKDKVVPRDLSQDGDVFKPDRDRIFGFRFWDNAVAGVAASRTRLYDTWIGEGFSPREVRAILGLKTTDEKEIRGTYVHEDMEKAGFYAPMGEGE